MKFKYYDTLNILISGGTFLYVLTEALKWQILNKNVVCKTNIHGSYPFHPIKEKLRFL